MDWTPQQVWQRIRGISEKLLVIFEEAERDGVTTMEVAERMARARLETS